MSAWGGAPGDHPDDDRPAPDGGPRPRPAAPDELVAGLTPSQEASVVHRGGPQQQVHRLHGGVDRPPYLAFGLDMAMGDGLGEDFLLQETGDAGKGAGRHLQVAGRDGGGTGGLEGSGGSLKLDDHGLGARVAARQLGGDETQGGGVEAMGRDAHSVGR